MRLPLRVDVVVRSRNAKSLDSLQQVAWAPSATLRHNPGRLAFPNTNVEVCKKIRIAAIKLSQVTITKISILAGQKYFINLELLTLISRM